MVKVIHQTSSGGGGGRGKKQEEDQWKEYRTKITQTDKYIDLQAQRVDKAESILEQAGLRINSKGVLVYATDNKNNLMSKLNVQADRIDLVVTGTGKNKKINTAEIVAGINAQKGESYVKIKADKINLSGYVTASQLETVDAKIANLISGTTLAGSIRANQLSGGSFKLNGHSHNNSTITIDGVPFNIVTWS